MYFYYRKRSRAFSTTTQLNRWQKMHTFKYQRHQSLNENPVLTNSVTEIFLKTYSWFFIKFLLPLAIDNTYVSQQGRKCSCKYISFGGNLTRNNLNFTIFEKELWVTWTDSIIGDRQHVDHYTLVQHATPNCESHQDYKGIFSDRSTGVLTGNFHRTKLKTNAFKKTNNIYWV
jgi:Fe-S cluster assembly protein SufD